MSENEGLIIRHVKQDDLRFIVTVRDLLELTRISIHNLVRRIDNRDKKIR
jgi:hypothetical protein